MGAVVDVDAVVAVAVVLSVVVVAAALSVSAASLPDSSLGFESDRVFLFLKSVTYQPVPFSWKPAADTFLT